MFSPPYVLQTDVMKLSQQIQTRFYQKGKATGGPLQNLRTNEAMKNK